MDLLMCMPLPVISGPIQQLFIEHHLCHAATRMYSYVIIFIHAEV
jgi:hypothetical protein